MRNYLSVAEVLAIHDNLIERYGGTRGVRDVEALAAAVNRPQTVYYTDLITEAAALWQSLSEGELFVDGAQRTAFAAVYTFLLINDIELQVRKEDSYKFVVELYKARGVSTHQLGDRLRTRIFEQKTRADSN